MFKRTRTGECASESTTVSRGLIAFTLGRRIIRPAVLFVSMNGPLGMISRVLHALNRGGFESLLRIGQLLYRFLVRLGDVGETLGIA